MEVEHSVASHATTIDKAVFVATDLEKYTSYEDAIKSNIQLNECFNYTTDFKVSRTITYKLQAREQTVGSHFQCIYLQDCSLVVSFKTTAKLGKPQASTVRSKPLSSGGNMQRQVSTHDAVRRNWSYGNINFMMPYGRHWSVKS